MASKSAKRKAAVADSDRGDEKRFKKENKSDKVSGTTTTSADQFLQAVTAFILPASIQKARLQIFKTQLKKYGGAVEDKLTSACTHVIVDDNMEIDRLCRLLKLEEPPQNTVIVKCGWLSACLREKHFVDVDAHNVDVSNYFSKHADTNIKKETAVDLDQKLTKTTGNEEPSVQVDKPASSTNDTNTEKLTKVGMMFGAFKRANNESGDESDADSDYVPSDGEAPPGGKLYDSDSLSSGDDFPSTSDVTGNSSSSPSTSPHKPLPRGNWVCAQSSKTLKPNVNKHITDKLEEMVKTYQSTNDRWRALGYQKAIQAIRKHPKTISSWEEAKALPGVGARLADKVWEIAESGELRKLNEFRSSEELKVISLFTDVWGAGAHTARTWYQQGLRSLDDLKSKANLTKQQKIGLSHYDDFLDRMPRFEVEEIQTAVRTIAEELVPGTRCEVCGSYRRGKPTCGDIDILITHPDGKSHRGIFAKLLGRLREEGYLTDDLVSGEENGNQKKYMGVFRLKGENRKHRRIDIIVTPVEEYACALVHFTGSAHFNRSIRHLAKKMGMSLSEHALRTGVIRKGGEKIFEGTALPTPTEESIFRHMGIPHRPPEERDH